jgi:acyl-CoA dehydrogenase
VQFHDYTPIFEAYKELPNVSVFVRQTEIFKDLVEKAGPDQRQDMDPSFSLPLGEMFSIIVYGQLILEQANLDAVDSDIVNQVFDFMVRDFAGFALEIYGNHATRDEQRPFCKEIMIIKAVADEAQYQRVWKQYVAVLDGEYEMDDSNA